MKSIIDYDEKLLVQNIKRTIYAVVLVNHTFSDTSIPPFEMSFPFMKIKGNIDSLSSFVERSEEMSWLK